ncbi:MAG: adenylate/guanylate cyclase domain-containing protein [Chloroherpetonaceae bacterium]|nr:adenylate/guanylate cyclase domain-containing protein [Chloroherpetonaceae bacterium]MDW8437758.1 adenylate/guanylate cyclase domain-containing protein [Chloroherpetonaceae bacterium]
MLEPTTLDAQSQTESAFAKFTRLTLQKKYSVSFSIIFIAILLYVLLNVFKSEEQDLIDLSNKNFKTLFRVVNTVGEEAMSVGESGRIALQETIKQIFETDIEGLEAIMFVDAKRRYYAYCDREKRDLSGEPVDSLLWESLVASGDSSFIEGGKVFLTEKIEYKTANKTIFLGYSRLAFSLDHIDALIARKQGQTLAIGLIGFAISLFGVSLLTAILIQRIKKLNLATKEVARGKFDQLPVKGRDEVAELTASFNEMTIAVKERLMMARYVSSSTIEQIKQKRPDELELGGSREELCFLFSDVRGFTTFSEQHSPDEVVRYLNALLNLQVEIIKKRGGDIDKFVGDEVMAAFRGEEKEKRAILAAIEIQQAMTALVKREKVFENLRIGIGINEGLVVTGNIGSRDRMDYTSIGDAVNTAARLCSAAGANEILISENVKAKLAEEEFALSAPFSLALKGKQTALNLYKVLYQPETVKAE